MNAQELKDAVISLPYLDVQRTEPIRELLAGQPPVECWPTYVNRIKDALSERDPYEFQQWGVISHTMMATEMGTGHALGYLKSRSDWHSRWLPLITDDHKLFHWRTALIQAYYMAQLEERTGVCIGDLKLVLEFGGGFGKMCYLFRKLGFQGRYLLFDFPVLLALQKFFLTEMGVSATYVSEPRSFSAPVWCSPVLFVAMFSLSEAPHLARQPFRALAPIFDFFLIGYSSGGGHTDMENDAYFRAWRDDMPHVAWHHERIPWTRSGYGLIGGKR